MLSTATPITTTSITTAAATTTATITDEWEVHKFGGTSVASSECYRNVLEIVLQVRKQQRMATLASHATVSPVRKRLCIVVSAMGEVKPNSQVTRLMQSYHRNDPAYQPTKLDKVTNLLIRCTEMAAHRDPHYKQVFEELKRRHAQVVEELINEQLLIDQQWNCEHVLDNREGASTSSTNASGSSSTNASTTATIHSSSPRSRATAAGASSSSSSTPFSHHSFGADEDEDDEPLEFTGRSFSLNNNNHSSTTTASSSLSLSSSSAGAASSSSSSSSVSSSSSSSSASYSHHDHGASSSTELSMSILHLKETLRSALEKDFDDLSYILRACWLSRSFDLEHNWWFGYGELWSARLLCTFINAVLLAQGRSLDRASERAVWLDAREALVLARTHEPMPDLKVSKDKLFAWLNSSIQISTANILVVTGYIASHPSGTPTTLGRDGSDYSASIMAALLSASHVVIWTDVDGVYSANPAQVKDAVLLDDLSYDEASELAYFGAKVLHPKTMTPVLAQEIPIWIKNTFNWRTRGSCIQSRRSLNAREEMAKKNPGVPLPLMPGTWICPPSAAASASVSSSSTSASLTDFPPTSALPRTGVAYGVKGFSEISNLCLIEVKGTGLIGVPGIATRMFSRLKEASCSVVLVTQAGHDLSMCVALPWAQGDVGLHVVRREFRDELQTHEIFSVEKTGPCACLAVVGDGMRHMRGVAGRVFSALADSGVNVQAIAQGSSERNISVIVTQSDATRALMAVHNAFLVSPTHAQVHGEYSPLLKPIGGKSYSAVVGDGGDSTGSTGSSGSSGVTAESGSGGAGAAAGAATVTTATGLPLVSSRIKGEAPSAAAQSGAVPFATSPGVTAANAAANGSVAANTVNAANGASNATVATLPPSSVDDDEMRDELPEDMPVVLGPAENRQVAKLRASYRLFTRQITLHVTLVVNDAWDADELQQLYAELFREWGERKEVTVVRCATVRLSADHVVVHSNASATSATDTVQPLDWSKLTQQLLQLHKPSHLSFPVLVDCTDSESMLTRYAQWIKAGIRVVTQRHLTSPLSVLNQCIPLLPTLHDLVRRKETITRIEAILPSELTFALTAPALATSRLSPVQISESRSLVARTLAAIAVQLGADVSASSVLDEVPLQQLRSSDEVERELNGLRAKATSELMTYQYVASITLPEHGGADASSNRELVQLSAGLRMCPNSHPFAWLRGYNTIVAIYTSRHPVDPILLQGPVSLAALRRLSPIVVKAVSGGGGGAKSSGVAVSSLSTSSAVASGATGGGASASASTTLGTASGSTSGSTTPQGPLTPVFAPLGSSSSLSSSLPRSNSSSDSLAAQASQHPNLDHAVAQFSAIVAELVR